MVERELSKEEQAIFIDFLRAQGDEDEFKDPIKKICEHVIFESSSKGRGRKRKFPVLVEMVRYAGRCRVVKEDGSNGIDQVATEVLEETVSPQNATRTFLQRLRRT